MRKHVVVMVGAVLIVMAWSGGYTFSATCCGPETSVLVASNPEVKEHKVTDQEVGIDAVCPVLGTKIKVQLTTLSLEYKDKVYYFCCAGCPEKFKKDPEKYIKPEAAK